MQSITLDNLFETLESQGVQLWLDQGQLKFKAPAGSLDEDLKQQIRLHRDDIMAHLTRRSQIQQSQQERERYEPFPLTDLQLAYVMGRSHLYDYGGVGCHSYIELDLPRMDGQRLEQAWHKLIARHDMLRAVIDVDGSQRVLRHIAMPTLSHDVHQRAAAFEYAVLATREAMSHRRYAPDQWPLHTLHLTSHDQASVLHISIDLLIADFASIQIMLAELGQYYHDAHAAPAPLAISYRQVLQHASASEPTPASLQARKYWQERIARGFPLPPRLPLAAVTNGSSAEPHFSRQHLALPASAWQALKKRAVHWKSTPSSVVLSAFCEILRRWSGQSHFCINMTLLNRPAMHADINKLVGDFIAVNVLAVEPQPGASFAERTQQIQQRVWEDMEHTAYTGMHVLRDLSQHQGERIMVPIVFTSTVGVDGRGLDSNDFMHEASLRYGITQTPQVWLDCQVTERGDTLHLDWDVRDGVFPPAMAEQAFTALSNLLLALASQDAAWQATQPVALAQGSWRTRLAANSASRVLVDDGLHSGFLRQVLKQPERIAVEDAQGAYRYVELAGKVMALRQMIVSQQGDGQASTQAPIAIMLDKGVHQIAAVLAVLASHRAYVPIDPGQPEARRRQIIESSQASLVLTTAACALDVEASGVINVDVQLALQNRVPCTKTNVLLKVGNLLESQAADRQLADSIAYILYTSGTTGQPKGVQVSHRAALSTVAAVNDLVRLQAKDKVLGLANYNFDLSVWDIFGSLARGATLVLPQATQRGNPAHWLALIAQHGVTLWNSVPAQMHMLTSVLQLNPDAAVHTLRTVMLSGDTIPLNLPALIHDALPQASILSLGGPTETSIWCVSHALEAGASQQARIPYGKPLPNHQIYILDQELEDCPDWVTGEMYIGGDGLAQGYHGDAERTSASFIHHPISKQRLYRSGDLGYYRPDGVIEILGRQDHQVKVHGHRIELGELEVVALGSADVESAVAVLIPEPISLGLMVKPATASASPQELEARLRQQLALSLPAYMQPAQIVLVNQIPLSVNGKVDRKTIVSHFLQMHSLQAAATIETPLDTPVEQTLQQIWRDILACKEISRDADFFKLGGSSLSAITLLTRLMAAGFATDLDMLFQHPVFKDMAQALATLKQQEHSFVAAIDLDAMASQALSGLAQAVPATPLAGAGTVLLTGASGYLGIHVLADLVCNTQWNVICLLRSKTEAHAWLRLEQMMQEKGLDFPLQQGRIKVALGDVSQPRLGLTEVEYQALSLSVDAIVHGASLINLMDPLAKIFPTNVQGAAHVIAFACSGKVKPVHYISTVAIHHALPEAQMSVHEDTPAVEAWQDVSLTYEQSKIMAEQLFYRARKAGLAVNILRPSTITWHSGRHAGLNAAGRKDSAQIFINDDAFLKFYRACLSARAYPTSSLLVNIVSVDVVAHSVVRVMVDGHGQSENYHLVAQDSVRVDDIYQHLTSLGCHFKALPFPAWKLRLQDSFVDGFVNLYFKEGMGQGGHRQYLATRMEAALGQHHVQPFTFTPDYLEPLAMQYGSPNQGTTGNGV